jgi:hypothetical protein
MNALGPAHGRQQNSAVGQALFEKASQPARDERRESATGSMDGATTEARRAELDHVPIDEENVRRKRTAQVAAFHQNRPRPPYRERARGVSRIAQRSHVTSQKGSRFVDIDREEGRERQEATHDFG